MAQTTDISQTLQSTRTNTDWLTKANWKQGLMTVLRGHRATVVSSPINSRPNGCPEVYYSFFCHKAWERIEMTPYTKIIMGMMIEFFQFPGFCGSNICCKRHRHCSIFYVNLLVCLNIWPIVVDSFISMGWSVPIY